jgi:Holliday junction resolvase RusA-like endonuclease
MQFSLIYRGPLKANGDPEHKHKIRQKIHSQLQILWQQKQLRAFKNYLKKEYSNTLIHQINNYEFAPLVSPKLGIVAELDIILFRPEEPGKIVTKTGDIDNRLKTLFDAL